MQSNNKSLVSVIMPTYNHSAYIKEAISSVLSQTYSNLELIIIDNYSTDNTMEIVDSFFDRRIQYYKFRNHGVIASSRNFGFTKSHGEYIAFIDSDDVWESLKLEYQIPHMQSVSCVSTNFKPIGDIDGFINYINSSLKDEYKDFDYDEVTQENPVASSSVLIRRDIFLQEKGFDENEEYKFIEDFELWLRLAYLGPIRVLNESLIQYRMYHKPNRDLRELRVRVLKIFDKHRRLGLLSDQQVRKASGNYYISIGRAFQNVGDFRGIVFYIKGLYYSYGIKNKLRAIAGLLLFFIPKVIRPLVVRKSYRIYRFFYRIYRFFYRIV
jgi:teichuronic acid biosynthesis glycosyltransferase TuaG